MTTTVHRVRSGGQGPDTYAHITRRGLLRHTWQITAGPTGRTLTQGRTLTRRGALLDAIAAANPPAARRHREW